MLLFGNKQMRAEEKIFGELSKEIKKSKEFSVKIQDNKEIYNLFALDICFDILKKDLIVTGKTGEKIISLPCDFTPTDVRQKRFSMFSNLLEEARKRANKEQEKANKQEKLNQAKGKLDSANKAKAQQQQQLESTVAALKKIKSL